MTADHELVIYWGGDTEYVSLVCNLKGSERPCAIIDCPVDHEDVTRDCIEEHGAKALDECWAESWAEAGDRDALNIHLSDTRIPVAIAYDEGVEVTSPHEGFSLPTQAQTLAWRRWKGYRTDLDACVMKLAEEAGEVVAAVLKMQEERPGFDKDHLALELAQAAICCMGAAEAAGIDLDSAVRGHWKAMSSGMPDA